MTTSERLDDVDEYLLDQDGYWDRKKRESKKNLLQAAHDSFLRTQGRTYAGIGIPAYPALSTALNGLRGSTLLTAPTGIGKTTLTLNIARSIAEASLGKPLASQVHVVYITTEMPAVTLVQRLLSDMTGTDEDNKCISIRKLMKGDTALPISTHETGKLWLGVKQTAQYESACQRFKAMDGTTLHIIDKEDLDDMAWDAYKDGDHALVRLQRLVDERTLGVQEVLVILDTIAHLDVEPSLLKNRMTGEPERQRYRDDLSRDEDITAALKKWRDHLGDSRALLSIHEESKARTGTGDVHAVRGSSRYAYGQDALLAMVYASSDKNKGGTVDAGIREDNESDTVFQIDLLVTKARDGGMANVTILLEHDTEQSRISEWPRDAAIGKELTALVTAKDRRNATPPKKAKARKEDED